MIITRMLKISFFLKCMFKSFIFMKMWTQMWIRRFSDIHNIMHTCRRLIIFYFNDINTNYVMESSLKWLRSLENILRVSRERYHWAPRVCFTKHSNNDDIRNCCQTDESGSEGIRHNCRRIRRHCNCIV